jgi:hypothetical protein
MIKNIDPKKYVFLMPLFLSLSTVFLRAAPVSEDQALIKQVPEKKAVFIVGPGRCGSSCTAGLLSILGLPLGDQLRTGIEGVNPKGFFEDIPTVELTKDLLAEENARFLKPRFFDWRTHPKREIFKQRIKVCLETHFSQSDFFGIKNPIIALFMPLYAEAAQELGYTPKVIVVTRPADQVYKSWRNNFKFLPREDIMHAMACYLKSIEIYVPSYDYLEVDFNDVVHDTQRVADRLKEFLPELKSYGEVEAEIRAFIDQGLKHHN